MFEIMEIKISIMFYKKKHTEKELKTRLKI